MFVGHVIFTDILAMLKRTVEVREFANVHGHDISHISKRDEAIFIHERILQVMLDLSAYARADLSG